MNARCACLMGLLLTAPHAVHAAQDSIYHYQQGGARVYSDRKPLTGPYAIISKYGRPTASASCRGVTEASLRARLRHYEPLVVKHADAHRVPPELVKAVMRVESCYDRHAISKVGARGLMQLMPDTAKELGVHDSFNADQNIGGGVRYLSRMLKRFNNDTRLALAAYNAGPGAVTQHKGIPPFEQTRSYVARVMKHYRPDDATTKNG